MQLPGIIMQCTEVGIGRLTVPVERFELTNTFQETVETCPDGWVIGRKVDDCVDEVADRPQGCL